MKHRELRLGEPIARRWGVPLYEVSSYNDDLATREYGLVPIRDECDRFVTIMAPPCWRTFVIQAVEVATWGRRGLLHHWLRAAWDAGLIEYNPREWGRSSIRVRPFPWRGVRREFGA